MGRLFRSHYPKDNNNRWILLMITSSGFHRVKKYMFSFGHKWLEPNRSYKIDNILTIAYICLMFLLFTRFAIAKTSQMILVGKMNQSKLLLISSKIISRDLFIFRLTGVPLFFRTNNLVQMPIQPDFYTHQYTIFPFFFY